MPIAANMAPLLAGTALRFVKCWKVTLTGGGSFYFTSAAEPITFEGNLHDIGGFRSAATESRDSFRGPTTELSGFIRAGAIEFDDLRGGLFDDCEIVESLVDWKYPFEGAFRKKIFKTTDIDFDNHEVTFHVGGLAVLIDTSVGKLYGRLCGNDLGDARCQVNLATFTDTGAVVRDVTDRKTFRGDHAGFTGEDDRHFNFGRITFTSGANDGITREVREGNLFFEDEFTFKMFQRFPKPIEVGDTFDIIAGCDRRPTTCEDKFSNTINLAAFHHMPGFNQTISLASRV
jgi:uncharacterized phage protein (TIGR02218 family)